MNPAVWPRSEAERERLLVLDGHELVDSEVGALADFLEPGDLVVVNDAATLPASLSGVTAKNEPIEARLFELEPERGTARAILFGAGSWRTPTEKRPLAPELRPGDRVAFGELGARVVRVLDRRVAELAFDSTGAELLSAIYRVGRPVQYSYVAGRFELWHVTSRFAARPWAFEMPSAGRPLTFGTLKRLRERGVRITALTHAAGLSSTGDDALDSTLPRPERYEIPERTAELVRATHAEGARVVAVGTTVVRALEASALENGRVCAGEGVARLVIGAAHPLRAVDALFTGVHAPGTSHFELLTAFVRRNGLERAHAHAVRAGYLGHELGDSLLVFSEAASARAA